MHAFWDVEVVVVVVVAVEVGGRLVSCLVAFWFGGRRKGFYLLLLLLRRMCWGGEGLSEGGWVWGLCVQILGVFDPFFLFFSRLGLGTG